LAAAAYDAAIGDGEQQLKSCTRRSRAHLPRCLSHAPTHRGKCSTCRS